MIGSPEGVRKVLILYIPVRFTKRVSVICVFVILGHTRDCKVARPIFHFNFKSAPRRDVVFRDYTGWSKKTLYFVFSLKFAVFNIFSEFFCHSVAE